MAELVKIELKLKNKAELAAAMRRASFATGKLPSQIINRAVYRIALRAQQRMPVTDPGRIRSELGEVKATSLVKLKSGRFSRAKKNIKSFFSTPVGAAPFLALIINSRSNPKYSGYWKRSESPFKGFSRAEGASRMLAEMRAQFNARIKSSGYFRLCASVIRSVFSKAVNIGDSGGFKGRGASRVASGQLAFGTGKAKALFWVSATQPDTHSSREALTRIAEPVWQEALDNETKSLNAYAARKEYEAALKLAGLKI